MSRCVGAGQQRLDTRRTAGDSQDSDQDGQTIHTCGTNKEFVFFGMKFSSDDREYSPWVRIAANTVVMSHSENLVAHGLLPHRGSADASAMACSPTFATHPDPDAARVRGRASASTRRATFRAALVACLVLAAMSTPQQAGATVARTYPLHTGIVSTTFWVGEIFDPSAADGSQMFSTYDDDWFAHFGGCDGVVANIACQTEHRIGANGYFPRHMKPKENPFYLDLPFDDVNDSKAFSRRAQVIPWANDPGYAGHATDPEFSYMKNRWVQITKGTKTCYGQIEDAGPGRYNDATYVFGSADARPQNREYNNAGMDVSPALNGCLGFASLDGENDRVSWRFVESGAVPNGPWRWVVTSSGVNNH